MPNLMVKKLLQFDVEKRLRELGRRIRLARVRRGWSVIDLAEKADINRNTLTALEKGRPGTALSACVTVLRALGIDCSLDAVADPDTDIHGKSLEASRRPTRPRKAAKRKDRYDF